MYLIPSSILSQYDGTLPGFLSGRPYEGFITVSGYCLDIEFYKR